MIVRLNCKTTNIAWVFTVLMSSLLLFSAMKPAEGQQSSEGRKITTDGKRAGQPKDGEERTRGAAKAGADKATIHRWIQGLASDKFQARMAATRALIKAGAPAIPALIDAAYSDDAEVRLRVKSILDHMSASAEATTANKARLASRIVRESPDSETARRVFGPLVAKGDVVDLARFIERNSDGSLTLNLRQTKVTAEHLRQLSSPSFKKVVAIEAGGTQLNDAALVHLKGLPLSKLGLHSTKITDAGLAHLKGLPLKTLSLGFTQVTDNGLAQLKGLSIESLMLAKTQVTDAGLAHLSHLPLRSLNLIWVDGITDAGLASLAKLRLESLSISSRKITDDGLKHLRGMPLRSLGLGGTQVSDAGIAHLVDLPLQTVWLYGTNLTDASLVHLQKIKTLKTVYIQNTQFSEVAAAKLRKTVSLVHTGRAKRANGARITMVVRISHAEIKRANVKEFKDPFVASNRFILDLIRAQARPKCIEMGYDPNNIGLPRYSWEAEKFKKDAQGYSGKMTFDFYNKRKRR